MEERMSQQQEFSIVKRAKSFTHAGRGVWIFFKTTHNSWIHLTVLAIVVIAGIFFRISVVDWLSIVLAAGFVLMAEAVNTAIEIDIDLTSPQYHPFARDTKDVAAGAVLIAAVMAVVVGVFIFAPHLLALIG